MLWPFSQLMERPWFSPGKLSPRGTGLFSSGKTSPGRSVLSPRSHKVVLSADDIGRMEESLEMGTHEIYFQKDQECPAASSFTSYSSLIDNILLHQADLKNC